MAVNLQAPDAAQLYPVAGVELGVAMAGVRKANRKDLLVVRLAPGTTAAGVFATVLSMLSPTASVPRCSC